MMKRLAVVLTATMLVFFAACSGGDDAEKKKRIYDSEIKALEKAKEVESVLLEADEKRQEEIEEFENN